MLTIKVVSIIVIISIVISVLINHQSIQYNSNSIILFIFKNYLLNIRLNYTSYHERILSHDAI